MRNYLKKVQINNPLLFLGMLDEHKSYENANTDEELADVYHKALDKAHELEGEMEKLVFDWVYAMIAYSTNKDINPLVLIK